MSKNKNRLYLQLSISQAQSLLITLQEVIQEVQIDNKTSGIVLENPDIYEPLVVLQINPD